MAIGGWESSIAWDAASASAATTAATALVAVPAVGDVVAFAVTVYSVVAGLATPLAEVVINAMLKGMRIEAGEAVKVHSIRSGSRGRRLPRLVALLVLAVPGLVRRSLIIILETLVLLNLLVVGLEAPSPRLLIALRWVIMADFVHGAHGVSALKDHAVDLLLCRLTGPVS